MKRVHELQAVKNFRDFGGYRGAKGRLRAGLLYRSGHHAQASASDLEAIAALDIATIVDLRNRVERAENPSRRLPSFSAAVIENHEHGPTPEEEAFGPAFEAYINSADATPEGVAAWSHQWYARCLFEPRQLDLFTRYFQALATRDGAILIHCARGKDRTGLLAALTHHLCGVPRDDILADYLMANGALAQPTDFGAHRADLRPEMFRALVDLRAEFLDTAWNALADRYGSVDGYLVNALGVDAKTRAQIEQRLLE